MSIPRVPWSLDFPSVVVHTTVAARDGHVDYLAAKSGDADAAFRVVRDLMAPAAMERIKDALAGRRPLIVPVHAIETTGINFLPEALGRDLGEYLSLPVTAELVQTNTVGHTRASGFHRLAFQPTFEGPVLPGQEYLLVDDHVGLGGTLANLRGHIENQGGRVILSTTLTASRRSEILALSPATLQALLEKHGNALEEYWRQQFGFGLDGLSEAEAGYLLRTPSFDAIRDRMAEAARQGLPDEL